MWNKEEEGEGEERGRNWRRKKRTGIPREMKGRRRKGGRKTKQRKEEREQILIPLPVFNQTELALGEEMVWAIGQVAHLLHSLATCFPIASALATTLQLCPLLMWDVLYQQNCTVELLIRIPPLSYALMRGANSPLIHWLV